MLNLNTKSAVTLLNNTTGDYGISRMDGSPHKRNKYQRKISFSYHKDPNEF